MFYVQKVERPVDGNEKETEVVFAAFELTGKAKNRNKKAKGYKSLKDAAKELGIDVSSIELEGQPVTVDRSDDFYAAVKNRLISGGDSRKVDAAGVTYPALSKAVLSVCGAVEYKGSVDDAVLKVLDALGVEG